MEYRVRAALVLVGLVVAFVAARWLLGPENLGLFQSDRSLDVPEQAAMPVLLRSVLGDGPEPLVPLQYVDTEECRTCHAERVVTWSAAAHRGINCETCHGPAQAHVDAGASLAIESPRELCERCHARLVSRPASHPQVDVLEHAGEASCTSCHNAHDPGLGGGGGPPLVPHSLEGRSECTLCHGPGGIKPYPESHAGRTSDVCLACHQQATGAGATATPTPQAATPTSTAATPTPVASGGPPLIPHSLEGRSECILCHGPTGIRPYPESHAGRTSDVCLACHQQATGAGATATPTPQAATSTSPTATPTPVASGGPPLVPHSLEGCSECTICHGPGGIKPYPANHEGRTSEICLACHQQE